MLLGLLNTLVNVFREYLLRMKLRLDPRSLLSLKTLQNVVNHYPMSIVVRLTAAQIRKMMYSTWINKLTGFSLQNVICPYTYKYYTKYIYNI
jgi:hypothetical protein